MTRRRDLGSILAEFGAVWSPDFDAYASGKLDVSQVRCALCQHCPCDCPEFGSDEYFALIDKRHGRTRNEDTTAREV